ncbi:MAG: tetratricopeptide repeat protein [Ignavibacteriaceae bacterium]
MTKKCQVCKESVKEEFAYCPYCGSNLNDKQKNKGNNGENSEGLKLSNSQILLTFAGIIAVVFIILFAAGTFDSPVLKVTGENTQAQQNMTQGPSLADLNKINELRDYIKNNPEEKDKILELGHLLMDNGYNEEAILNYDKFLNFEPKNPDVLIDKGVCYFNLEQYEKAEEIMLTGLKINPRHIIGIYNIGIVNLAKQNREKAREWFQKVIELDPNSDYALQAKQLLESH